MFFSFKPVNKRNSKPRFQQCSMRYSFSLSPTLFTHKKIKKTITATNAHYTCKLSLKVQQAHSSKLTQGTGKILHPFSLQPAIHSKSPTPPMRRARGQRIKDQRYSCKSYNGSISIRNDKTQSLINADKMQSLVQKNSRQVYNISILCASSPMNSILLFIFIRKFMGGGQQRQTSVVK